MGAGSSIQEAQPISLQMEAAPNYPDMNVIFKGIPKIMQVADDMHRMTNYIMDLRNMTLALSIMSIIGMFIFLIIKYVQLKNSRRRRRRYQHALDPDQNSLSRTGEIGMGNGSNATENASTLRYYSQKQHPSHFVSSFDWNASRHVPADMEKLLESQHSNSTVPTHHHVNNNNATNNHNSNNGSGAQYRQTPPQTQSYAPFTRSYHGTHHYSNNNNNSTGNNCMNGSSATSGITGTIVDNDPADRLGRPYPTTSADVSVSMSTSMPTVQQNNNNHTTAALTRNGVLVNSHLPVTMSGMNGSMGTAGNGGCATTTSGMHFHASASPSTIQPIKVGNGGSAVNGAVDITGV